jgi:predicted N-formylglutamate amidohydrolase
VSRLLVELNRSPHHPALFSEISRRIPRPERERILARYYWPHWKGVLQAVTDGAAEGKQVIHLAVHTFTPVLVGEIRLVEMGILYDPGRDAERAFARRWREALRVLLPEGETGLRIRFNQPYRGTSDSLPTWLRKRFPPQSYLGVEMEVNQGLIMKGGAPWAALRSAILRTLAEAIPPPLSS